MKTKKTTSHSSEVTLLYGGRVRLTFTEKTHKYIIEVDDKKVKPPSVTQICGVIDKSGPIHGWAVKETLKVARSLIEPGKYYSVSELDTIWEKSRKASYVKKQEAADVGTAVHKWIELYFHGQEPELPPEDPYLSCIQAFLTWVKDHSVKIILNERPVYSIYHNFTGRMDGLAEVDGKKTLIDFKSGNGVYSESRFQTAAYKTAYEEEYGYPSEKLIEQRAVIRLGKDDGKFYQRIYDHESYEEDISAFRAALLLYTRLKKLESEKTETTSNKGDWLDEI